jgi:hypothetical protein
MRRHLKFTKREWQPLVALIVGVLVLAPVVGADPLTSPSPSTAEEFAVLRASDGSPRIVPYTVRGQEAFVNNVLPIGRAQTLRRTTASLLQKLGREPRALADPLQANATIDALKKRPNLMALAQPLTCFRKDWCWPDTHIYYQIQPELAAMINKHQRVMNAVIEDALKEIGSSSSGAWTFCSIATLDPKQAKRLNKPQLFFQSADRCSSARGHDEIVEDGFGEPHAVNLSLSCGVSGKMTPGYTDVFSVVHEVLHALGFSHAHQNPSGEAEKVLSIDTANIVELERKNFLVFADSPWGKYDFCSVMHYAWNEYFSDKYFKIPGGSRDVFKLGADTSAVRADLQDCADQWRRLAKPPQNISPPYDQHTLVGQRWFISDTDRQLLIALATLSTSSGKCNDKSDFADK